MIQRLDAPISVTLEYNHHRKSVRPTSLTWENRDYPVKKIGFHHTYWQGRVLIHVYSVMSDTVFFRLELDTQSLFWRLKEIADDLPD